MRHSIHLLLLIFLVCSCVPHRPSPGPSPSPGSANLASPSQSNRPTYRCIGNEPFWDASIRGDEIKYSSFYPEEKMSYALTDVDVAGKVRTFTGKGSAGSIIIILKEETSNDTMSDKTYPYSARVKINNRAERRGAAEIVE